MAARSGNEMAARRPERVPTHPGAILREDVVLRLGKFCGNGPELWLRMQQAYDLWHAERALRKEIEQIPTAKAKAA